MRPLILALCLSLLAGSPLRAQDEKKGKGVSMPAQTLPAHLRPFLLAPVQRVPDSILPGDSVDVHFDIPAPAPAEKPQHEKVSHIRLFAVEQQPDGTDKVTLGVDPDTQRRLAELRTLPNSVISVRKNKDK